MPSGLYRIVVQANGTESNSLSKGHRERLLRVPYSGRQWSLIGRLERGPIVYTAPPLRRPCTLYAVRQGASEERPACSLLRD